MKKVEIDYFENNEHITVKNDGFIVQVPIFPKGFIGKIVKEFIENEEGKFEEFIFKEIEEE